MELDLAPELIVGEPGYEENRLIYEIKVSMLERLKVDKNIIDFNIKKDDISGGIYASVRYYPKSFIKFYKKENKSKSINNQVKQTITVRAISLDEERKCMIINNGELEVNFNYRGKDEIKETKTFKILVLLWENKKLLKNNKIKGGKIGEAVSLNTLKKLSGALSYEAVLQSIKRLNKRFKKENIPIKIKTSPKKKEALMVVEYK